MSKLIPNEFICEIRYSDIHTFRDKRGESLEKLHKLSGLPAKGMHEIRIDLATDNADQRLFVSVRNCGFVLRNITNDMEFFKFGETQIKNLAELDCFSKDIFITRIGVKSRKFIEYEGEFDTLMKKFNEAFAPINDKVLRSNDATMEDIGVILDMKDNIGKFKVIAGPMRSLQASEILEMEQKLLPDVGIYLDVDYSKEPMNDMQLKYISDTFQKFADWSLRRINSIKSSIIGEK